MNIEAIKLKAKEKAHYIDGERNKPYFVKALYATTQAGLIRTNYTPQIAGVATVDDIIRAGEIEPRFLEVLPALLLKFPDFIEPTDKLPEDLLAIRRGDRPVAFRGLNYRQWL